eukprot:2590855-Amphidinium_carterae.1
MERSPSARLHPPVLQVHTKGPGFLASPILITGFHQGRRDQATTWLSPVSAQGGVIKHAQHASANLQTTLRQWSLVKVVM